MVGRETEVTVLQELVRQVRRGGRIAVVEGEAGIGKSRLVSAALDAARAAGSAVLVSRAEELDLHRPFAAILDSGWDRLDPAWRERIAGDIAAGGSGPDVDAERQFRVGEVVLELIEERCRQGSVTVAIEDLQWADRGTIGVIALLARSIDALPVALIVSVRPQPRSHELGALLGLLESRGARTVALGPLDEDGCAELVGRIVGARPGPHLLEQVEGAAGNPFFIEELMGVLQALGAIERRAGMAETAVAQSTPPLPITILHRLSFLPADELELLGLASVLGNSFSAGDLALLADRHVAQLVPALRSACRAGVLGEQGDRLAFRHALIRGALYEDMPLSVRRALHGAFARSLAQIGGPPERMTEHLLRAAAPGDARSRAALVSTARELVVRAPSAAVELLHRAIELSSDPRAARLELLAELAQALVSAGLLGEGEAACREAIERASDGETATRLRLLLVMLLTRRPRTATAVREAELGVAGTDTGTRESARLRGWLALARVLEGDADGAVRDAEALLSSAEDTVARLLAVDALALAAGVQGRFADAAGLIAESAAEVEAIGSREAYDTCPHMILGLQLARLDRLDDAYAAIQRGRRASEALGMIDTLASFHFELAAVELLRGRIDDALAELATHEEYAEQTGAGWSVPADSLRALIDLHRGELLAADEHVDAAERAAAAGAPRHRTDLMVLARARLLEATGLPQAALERVADAFGRAQAAGAVTYHPVLAPELARLAALSGMPDRAAATVPALEHLAKLNPGVSSLRAAALRARGWLEADASPLLSAVELLRGTGRVLETARVAEEAAAAVAAERKELALELLYEARATYERSGATYDLGRVEAALRARGARTGARGPRGRPARGWDALTDSELRVVRLVSERLTNPEIAERLFISRRTVQSHVSHALSKLGVSSRRELAAEAAAHAGWRFGLERAREDLKQPQPTFKPAAGSTIDPDHP